MKNNAFFQMFVHLIQDLYDCENQILKALPVMIQNATNEDLKVGLNQHLEETKEQVSRLKQVFNLMGQTAVPRTCKAIQGLIDEGEQIIERKELTPAVKDAFIIVACQKIEHYEIACYGSATALGKHLKAVLKDEIDFDQICDLLEESLDEESKADKKLTKVAEGRFFLEGVNKEAEKELKAERSR